MLAFFLAGECALDAGKKLGLIARVSGTDWFRVFPWSVACKSRRNWHPNVRRLLIDLDNGVRIKKAADRSIAVRLQRPATIGTWSVYIEPKPV